MIMTEKITLRDLIRKEINVDVCDDYDESIYIVFCGPCSLTKDGEEKFRSILDYPLEYDYDSRTDSDWITIPIDTEKTGWKKDFRLLREFFNSFAGYCSESDYEKWFLQD